MRIIAPSVMLVAWTPNAEQVIERMGRISYKSEDKITADSAPQFIRMLIERGHESVIEHASASVVIVTDRGVTHEEVRHRIASYTQESTRYCNYAKSKFDNEIAVIEPGCLTAEQKVRRRVLMEQIERVYMLEISEGQTPQIARGVLPTCLKTEIGTTFNLREWRHFFKLRCAKNAHPQMRYIARTCLKLLYDNVAATVFEDFWKQHGFDGEKPPEEW